MTRAKKGSKHTDHELAISARQQSSNAIDSMDPTDLYTMIKSAPSLRGMVAGYIAETQFIKMLSTNSDVSDIRIHDDHDRTNNKADVDFVMLGQRVSVQLKSIQTNSIAWRSDLNCLYAIVQNDGSDRRTITLPSGNTVSTTNYMIGQYDILAVPLFNFTGTWEFAYKLNRDCRKTKSSKYSSLQQQYLLSTREPITYPIDCTQWFLQLSDAVVKLGNAQDE